MDWAAPVEVLLHLHGWSTGGRERANDRKKATVGRKGTVRDVEIDKVPQQMVASGRNMIAVLPQGDARSQFGPTSGAQWDALVREVLQRLVDLLPELEQPPRPARLVLSAHSGGGGRVAELLRRDSLPDRTMEILLFDAVNGKSQRQRLEAAIKHSLSQAVATVEDAAEQGAEPDALVDLLESTTLRVVVHTASGTMGRGYGEQHRLIAQTLSSLLRRHRARLKRVDPSGRVFEALKSCFQLHVTQGAGHSTVMGDGSQPADNSHPTTEAPPYTPGSGALERALRSSPHSAEPHVAQNQ